MTTLTDGAKDIKKVAPGAEEKSGPVFKGLGGAFLGGLTLISGVFGVLGGGTLATGITDSAYHGAKLMASEIVNSSHENFQIHGNLKDDGNAVIVTDKDNPKNFMTMKLEWNSFGGGLDNANQTYEQDSEGYGYFVLKAAISPEATGVAYEKLLKIAQDTAEKREASLQLPDNSQTASHIAGYATKEMTYESKQGRELPRSIKIPFTYHQTGHYAKLAGKEDSDYKIERVTHSVFFTYNNTVKPEVTYQSDGAKMEDIKNGMKAPVVTNVDFKGYHRDYSDGPGK